MAVFLDASYIIGLLDSKDQWHAAAVGLQRSLGKARPTTHSLVVAEAVSVVGPRRGGKLAKQVYDTLWEACDVVEPTRSDLDEAMGTVVKFDGGLSLSDALAVVVAKKKRLRAIVSFDSDFDGKGVPRLHKAG